MEKERWLKVIPRDNIPDPKDTPVCEIHWPKGYPTIRVHGKVQPRDAPSIFPGVPKSMIPTPPSKPRPTSKTSLTVCGKKEDELTSFLQKDKITYESLIKNVVSYKFASSITYYTVEVLHIQSCFFTECLPMFQIKISKDLTFLACHILVCSVM